MYCPVRESVGGEVFSGLIGSESDWVSESEFSRRLPTPSAGFVSAKKEVCVKSQSEEMHSWEVSISGVRPHPRAKLDNEWKWLMMTRAWASSDTDQLSAPRRRLWRE